MAQNKRRRNKETLAKKLADEFGIDIKDGKKYIEYIFSQIPAFLMQEKKLIFFNFGTLELKEPNILKQQRCIDNKIRLIKCKNRIKFTPCKKWKELINQGNEDRIIAVWDVPPKEGNSELKNNP